MRKPAAAGFRYFGCVKWIILVIQLGLVFAASAQTHRYSYIENKGQWPEQVLYRAQIEGGFVWVEQGGLRVDLRDYAEVSALHANPQGDVYNATWQGHCYFVSFGTSVSASVPSSPEITKYNYFQGNNPASWASDCHGFAEVVLPEVYPGIDLRLYSNAFFIKTDWIVHPGAAPEDIQLTYAGLNGITLENGRLALATSLGEVFEQKPITRVTISASGTEPELNQPLKSRYTLVGEKVGYHVDNIPEDYSAITIDPELIFSTYSGSFADNFGYTATYDAEGNLYSGSSIFGDGYPTTLGAYQVDWAGGDGQGSLAGTDIAITKYKYDGTDRIYSTYIGGASDELPHSLICDENGELVLFGTTSSSNYPVSLDAYQPGFIGGGAFAPSGVGVDYLNGSDIVVTRFSADGNSLIGSTFLGGDDNDGVNTAADLKFNYADEMRGEVLLDADGNVVVVSCTYSDDFPVTTLNTVWGGGLEGTVTVLSPDLSTITWSTYLGGSGDDAVYSVAIGTDGALTVCGGTTSSDLTFPGSPLESVAPGGQSDGFLYRIDAAGSTIEAGTYFGSPSYDQLYFVELDENDVVHVFGQTQALGDYWISNAAYGQANSGMIVGKFANGLSSLDWTTVVGTGSGKANLSPTAFLVDKCGLVYLSGWGGSTNVSSNPNGTDLVDDMPITPDAYQSITDGSDFYLMVLQSDASEVVYATYFGGGVSAEHVDGGTSRFNPDGVVYQSVCAGCGSNDDFPFFPADGVSDINNSPNCNNGVFKFLFDVPPVQALFEAPTSGCVDAALTFTNLSSNASSYHWDFDDGQTSSATSPTHSFGAPGEYVVSLTASNDACGFDHTYQLTITISDLTEGAITTTANPVYLNEGESSQLLALPGTYTYEWSPAGTLDNAFDNDPVATQTLAPPITCWFRWGV